MRLPTPIEARRILSGRASDVAPWLLGATLTTERVDGTVAVCISEVEAYEGSDDPASHAFRGPTARNAVMFGPAGYLYVYFVYGMHWCANVVCGPDGQSSALLIRAGTVLDGVQLARLRRPAARSDTELARGPARLATCLALSGSDGGNDLLDPHSPVRLTLPAVPSSNFRRGPRVGVAAGREPELRFSAVGDPSVSAFRPGVRRRRG